MQLSKKRRKQLVHAADEARYHKDRELAALARILYKRTVELDRREQAVEAREKAAGPIPQQDVRAFAAEVTALATSGDPRIETPATEGR